MNIVFYAPFRKSVTIHVRILHVPTPDIENMIRWWKETLSGGLRYRLYDTVSSG